MSVAINARCLQITMLHERDHSFSSDLSFTFDFGKQLDNLECRAMALNNEENHLLLVGNHQLKLIRFETFNIKADDASMVIPYSSHLQSLPFVDVCNVHRPVVQWNHGDQNHQYAVAVDRLVRFYTVDGGRIYETSSIIDTHHQVSEPTWKKKGTVRWPGVEPGSAAWKATMLTVTPPTRRERKLPVD